MVLELQREIKKRTVTYGVAAVLLAVVLTVVCFDFGFQPDLQPSPSPKPLPSPSFSQLKTFSSYEELKNFLKTSVELAKRFGEQPPLPFFKGEAEIQSPEFETAPVHSTTNVQVAGVDEGDIVKTDGEYLYVVSKGSVYLLRAYPPEQAEVLSKINLEESYGTEVYVNGDKLVVLGNRQHFPLVKIPEDTNAPSGVIVPVVPYWYEEAFVKVYNISDRTNPVLTRTLSLNGTLSGSRLIGSYVYAVVNQPAIRPSVNETDLEITLPRILTKGDVKEVQPTEIRYVDVPDVFYYFTTVVAVNVMNDTQEPTSETFLTGSTACMYVSQSNIYLAVPKVNVRVLPLEAAEKREETLIYRVKLDGEKMVCAAEGAVSGRVLNQFSMDEHGGFFRIATTEWTSEGSQNNLFVLDMSLNVVGKLEALAPGERIYSARFLGNRCYLVTFRRVDPFFVIDLSNPAEPKVLGKLKIPGFSGYLHPYDGNHVIGIGKQDNNLKLSLFDVKNVTAPKETAKFVVQGDWSDSPVLRDHKAFLFDKSKQLLALPVSISHVELKTDGYYLKSFWQGAYVFEVSLEQGFKLKGNVTHQNGITNPFEGSLEVKRILYIEDVLYTVSEAKVKMNDLENLQPLNEIELYNISYDSRP